MNRDKREPEYPVELESQFILRLPEEPAKALREVLKTGENFKNRLTIQVEDDMRHGEVRFDHWLLHAKIVDLPTIVESLKTIDRKSIYKTADICQMMICKDELDPTSTEEESPTKNKKKDTFKVDKKFLYPHGITPPTKNVRKRRFRKTLKKKSAEAPEIEKEVKRLLRADNEAISISWEVIKEEDDISNKPESSISGKFEKAKTKKELKLGSETANQSSKVEDIFGEAVSDSDLEDENINVDMEDNRLSSYDDHMSDSSSIQGAVDYKSSGYATQFRPEMFQSHQAMPSSEPHSSTSIRQVDNSALFKTSNQHLVDDYLLQSNDSDDIGYKMQQLSVELEELKQKRHRTQQEIAGMENMTLKQRFLDILQTLNQDITYKEIEYQNLQSINK